MELKENKAVEGYIYPQQEAVILQGYRGSISHGTYNPDPDSVDDIDIMAFVIPGIDYYFGLKKFGDIPGSGTQVIMRGRYDVLIYEIKKAFILLSSGNPSVLCMLWLNSEHYTHVTNAGLTLIKEREIFNSKLVITSMLGYANNQLKRMRKGQLGINVNYQGCMGAKRKALLAKCGYDTKYALHLIRLLKMCLEFIREHRLYVYRQNDLQMLLEIKHGDWTYDNVSKYAEALYKICNAEADKVTSLPETPDFEKVNQLCLRVMYLWKKDVSATHHELLNAEPISTLGM